MHNPMGPGPTTRKNLVSCSVISLLISIHAIYIEQLTFLEFQLLLVTLIGVARHKSSLVLLIKFL